MQIFWMKGNKNWTIIAKTVQLEIFAKNVELATIKEKFVEKHLLFRKSFKKAHQSSLKENQLIVRLGVKTRNHKQKF